MKYFLGKRLLIGAFAIITILLAVDFIFTYRNSKYIEANMLLQQKSEKTKMVVSYIAIDIVHNLDLGIRSYALFRDPKYLYPYYKALERKDSILREAEALLANEHLVARELSILKDSLEAYVALNAELKILLDKNDTEQFLYLANRDQGYKLWLQYERLANKVDEREDEILVNAKRNYAVALNKNYYLQLILFLICVPTLLFTIVHTLRKFVLEKQLRKMETDRANLLKTQNEDLERIVCERTKELIEKNRTLQTHDEEIMAQNEEIRLQNEQIAAQRDLLAVQNNKLIEAQAVIEAQQQEIKDKNETLEIEVQRKTNELMSNNQQLEQFAFASAHNLRAPVARILGLGNLLQYGEIDCDEEKMIVKNLIKSTVDLDMVIRDLNALLEIRTGINVHLTCISFRDEVQLVKSNLAKEIWDTSCEITEDFEGAPSVVTVKAYIDSILFNLISNSIKYRSPDRIPVINLKTSIESNCVCLEVMDNGLGIDLETYGKDIFSLYKRFHTHTEGKGLGLHLVKMQAAALGGTVEVSSQPGVGSVFKVYLKAHPGMHASVN